MGQPLSSKFHLVGCELVRAIRDVYPIRLNTLPDPFGMTTRPVVTWNAKKHKNPSPERSRNGSLYEKRVYDLDRASRNALIQSGVRHTSAR